MLIVENKVNLLALPPLTGTVAVGGLGDGVTHLQYLGWLSELPIWYWGDVDVAGFAILSRLRRILPQVQSLLMDHAFVCRLRHLAEPGTGQIVPTLANLTDSERAAFAACAEENLRIEQERVPQESVLESLKTVLGTSVSPSNS